jgi:tagaturonate reductase
MESGNFASIQSQDHLVTIVTGMPDPETKKEIEKVLGHRDDLLTICEVYRLWAIEGNAAVKKIVSFEEADEGMIITPDIDLYRELKLRLLDGTHTLSFGIAFLAGIQTMKEAMENASMDQYIRSLMQSEIGPYIPYPVEKDTVSAFITTVSDLFRNPHIQHFWKNITLNYTQKLKARCVPVLLNYYGKNDCVPDLFVLGFAAYFAFMTPVSQNGKEYSGDLHGRPYIIQDEVAQNFYVLWQQATAEKIIHEVLKNESFWGTDLSVLPGFEQAVHVQFNNIIRNGMKPTLEIVLSNKISNDASQSDKSAPG